MLALLLASAGVVLLAVFAFIVWWPLTLAVAATALFVAAFDLRPRKVV